MRLPPPTWRDRVAWAVHHQRTAMAVKAATAACLSWLIALNIPGPAHEYPYYAPLGAVVTMYPTVASSVRQSLQAVAAITTGAVLALVADQLFGHGAVVLALVVGLGVLLGGLPWLGGQRSYVPIAALFVLVIGRDTELVYAGSYAGLFLVGALTTVAINAAFPAFPVRQARGSIEALRDAVAAHLRYLADRLRDPDQQEPLRDRDEDRPGLTRLTDEARSSVLGAVESARGNRRARHHPEVVASLQGSFRALERAVLLVDDVYALARDEPWGQGLLSVSAELREPMARALEELAGAVTSVGLEDTEPGRRKAVDGALADLTAALRRRERRAAGWTGGDGSGTASAGASAGGVEESGTGTAGAGGVEESGTGDAGGQTEAEGLVVSTIVTTLRRTLSVLTPPDRIRLAPTPEGTPPDHERNGTGA